MGAMSKTSRQFEQVKDICLDIFEKKMHDYGCAWRILRTSSLTDQIFIKAQRIRSIQDKGTQKIGDDIRSEFIGIINYSVMALIQLSLGAAEKPDLEHDKAVGLYNKYYQEAASLMENKNHDYGEAWREMRVSSFVDIILMKLLRIKQIEDNKGETVISEGIDANYHDIINYAVFAMIKIDIEKDQV